jgi:hypothetical protein
MGKSGIRQGRIVIALYPFLAIRAELLLPNRNNFLKPVDAIPAGFKTTLVSMPA